MTCMITGIFLVDIDSGYTWRGDLHKHGDIVAVNYNTDSVVVCDPPGTDTFITRDKALYFHGYTMHFPSKGVMIFKIKPDGDNSWWLNQEALGYVSGEWEDS